MKKDFVIYDVQWILDADPDRAGALERTTAYNQALVQFLNANGLFENPRKWDGFDDWPRFAFSASDLTEEGFELVRRCHDRWLNAIDRGKKNLVDMGLWKLELERLRGAAH